jgi:hypothetical protein
MIAMVLKGKKEKYLVFHDKICHPMASVAPLTMF